MSSAPTTADSTGEPNHGRIVIVAWIILSLIATPLVAIYLGPIIPPGNGTAQATEQVFDNQVMTTLITPLLCLLLVYFVYTLTEFRAKAGSTADGPPIRGDSRIQFIWVVTTSAIVLSLAAFGTFELLQTGSGGGQGPSPIAYPGQPPERLRGAGDRSAVAVHVPLPVAERDGEQPARPPGATPTSSSTSRRSTSSTPSGRSSSASRPTRTPASTTSPTRRRTAR